MSRRHVAWRDRYGEQVTCVRCLEVRDTSEVDRLLWCEDCRRAARARATRWGWAAGAGGALGLAAWIWWVVEPSDLVMGGWIATVVAAAWIGSKIARESIYGGLRVWNRRAVEATPPPAPGDPPSAPRSAGGDRPPASPLSS